MNPYMKSSAGNPVALKNRVAPSPSKRKTNPFGAGNSASGSYGVPKAPKKTGQKSLRNSISQINIAPSKIIFWSLVLGVLGFVYITHVFTTQQLLQEVNQVQREFERVQIIHEDRSLTHDRLTGPAEVFTRARALGYQDSGPANHVIIIGD